MVTELMLQRVEADLKEVVQGPVDVTGRADDGRPVGAGLGDRGQQDAETAKTCERAQILRWGPGCRDGDDGAAAWRSRA
jgi:hypothetical protein